PAFLRRGGLKRIEPCEDQFRKSIITSGHYPLIAARSHTAERVTNSICTRSTGVRNHLTGNRKPKNVLLRIDYGFLRRVIGNPCWGVSEILRLTQGSVILFSVRHAAACRPDYS